MSVRKDIAKPNKLKEKEKMQYLIANVGKQWPDLTINEELLRSPTTEFVKPFYFRLYSEFEKITGDIRQNILHLEIDADGCIPNDDIALTIGLNKICVPLGMPVYLNDICDPQPKRTVVCFTLLMNVIIYLKSDNTYVTDITECVKRNQHFQELKLTKKRYLHEITQLDELHVELCHNVETLKEEIENLTKEYKEVMVKKTEKSFKYQEDYKVINKLKKDLNAADNQLSHLREESGLLKEQVINEDEVEELKNNIELVKTEFEALENDRINITSILEDQEEKFKHYKKCLLLLENPIFSSENFMTLNVLYEQLNTLHKVEKKTLEEIKSKETELNKLHADNSEFQQNHQQLLKDLETLKNDTAAKLSAINNDFNEFNLKIIEEKKVSLANEKEIENLEEVRSKLIETIAEASSTFKNRYEMFLKHKQNLYKAFTSPLKDC